MVGASTLHVEGHERHWGHRVGRVLGWFSAVFGRFWEVRSGVGAGYGSGLRPGAPWLGNKMKLPDAKLRGPLHLERKGQGETDILDQE
jgi:hypothetical protein